MGASFGTAPACGDGLTNTAAGEICDLGANNGQPGSACAANCKRSDGQVCAGDGECGSGACKDGFCCNNGCAGLCEACSAAKSGGTNGVCSGVTVGTDPDNECPNGANMNLVVCGPVNTCQM